MNNGLQKSSKIERLNQGQTQPDGLACCFPFWAAPVYIEFVPDQRRVAAWKSIRIQATMNRIAGDSAATVSDLNFCGVTAGQQRRKGSRRYKQSGQAFRLIMQTPEAY
jgi:hypothetical protein